MLIVGVQIIAAETDREAQRLFTTPQQRFLRLIRNQPVELLPPVESMDSIWTEYERDAVMSKLGAAIVGSNETVEEGIEGADPADWGFRDYRGHRHVHAGGATGVV